MGLLLKWWTSAGGSIRASRVFILRGRAPFKRLSGMRRGWILVGLVLVMFPLVSHGGRAADCSPLGNVHFICGLNGPEDLVQVPGTSWIVASSVPGGPIQLVHARDHKTVAAFPSPTARRRFDAATYASCPGPVDAPGAGRSITHGINIRAGRNGIHTLYVVHHGFRESIEVFEIDARPATPTFTWTGCIPVPGGVTLNGVAPLPDGGVVATRPGHGQDEASMAAALAGRETGDIREWHPGDGWTVIPGSAGPGPNGIEASPDGRWLYVALWPVKKIMRISRGQAQVEKAFVDVSFYPDNIRWQTDGTLLAGGHYSPTQEEIVPCMSRKCETSAARVARLDPRTFKAQELVSYPSNDVFFGGTAALQVGKEIWIGSFRNDRIARYPIR